MFGINRWVYVVLLFCMISGISISCSKASMPSGSAGVKDSAGDKAADNGLKGNSWDYFPGGDDDIRTYDVTISAGGKRKKANVVMCNLGKTKLGSNEGILDAFYIDDWNTAKNVFNVVGNEVIMYGAIYASGETVEYKPEAVVFRYPPKVGDKWINTSELNGYDTTYEVLAEEELNLPAGKIKAFKINCATTYGPKEKKSVDNWYAAGIGLVKMEETTIQGDDKAVVVLELKGYRVNGKKGGAAVPEKYIEHTFIDSENNPHLAEMREYFPMDNGTVILFSETMPLGNQKKTFRNAYEVQGLKVVDGREVLVIVSAIESQGYIPVEDYYFIEGDSIMKIGRSSARKGKMVPYLKFPLKDGTKWGFDGNNVKETYTVKGVEEVKTPAGTFKGIRIDSKSVSTDGMRSNGTSSAWYVKGKGYVKRVSKMSLPGGKVFEIVEQLSEIHERGQESPSQ